MYVLQRRRQTLCTHRVVPYTTLLVLSVMYSTVPYRITHTLATLIIMHTDAHQRAQTHTRAPTSFPGTLLTRGPAACTGRHGRHKARETHTHLEAPTDTNLGPGRDHPSH